MRPPERGVGTGGVVTLLALIVLAGVPAGMGLVELLIWMLGGRP